MCPWGLFIYFGQFVRYDRRWKCLLNDFRGGIYDWDMPSTRGVSFSRGTSLSKEVWTLEGVSIFRDLWTLVGVPIFRDLWTLVGVFIFKGVWTLVGVSVVRGVWTRQVSNRLLT